MAPDIGPPTWLCVRVLLSYPVQCRAHYLDHVTAHELEVFTLNSSHLPKNFSNQRMFSPILVLVIKIKNVTFLPSYTSSSSACYFMPPALSLPHLHLLELIKNF